MKPMRTVLVSGFEPFGGEQINPSWLVAQALAEAPPPGLKVLALQLSTAFDASASVLKKALARHAPDAVVCLGQAGGRAALSFERIAINLNDAPIADNAGHQPREEAIAQRGPAAYWSTLPIRSMAQAALDAGVAAELSNTAGTFVCNHVFYALMRVLARKSGVCGGFVHVPFLPEQTQSAPSMPLAQMVRGMQAALSALNTLTAQGSTSALHSGRIA
jgi:pyroglutamyl-peptidase